MYFVYSLSSFYKSVLQRRREYYQADNILQFFKNYSENRENVFSEELENIRASIQQYSLAIIHLAGNTDYGRNRVLDKKNCYK